MGTSWSHEDGRGHSCFFGSQLQSLERSRLAKFLNVLLASYIFGKCWVWKIAIFYLDNVRGGYSNLLSSGIFPVIFQLAFWCARIYCCWERSRPATRLGDMAVRTCVSALTSRDHLCTVRGRLNNCVPSVCVVFPAKKHARAAEFETIRVCARISSW